MKQFQKYGVAAAVASVATGVVATEVSKKEAGDLAIVPYYTVLDGKNTGIHIINTTAATQVVKVRLRRGADSADALDFNLIMSPYDEWTANLGANPNGPGVQVSTTTPPVPPLSSRTTARLRPCQPLLPRALKRVTWKSSVWVNPLILSIWKMLQAGHTVRLRGTNSTRCRPMPFTTRVFPSTAISCVSISTAFTMALQSVTTKCVAYTMAT